MKLVKNEVENEEMEVIEVAEKKSVFRKIAESKPGIFIKKHKRGVAIGAGLIGTAIFGISRAIKHAGDDIEIVDLDEDDGIDPDLMEDDDSETEETTTEA